MKDSVFIEVVPVESVENNSLREQRQPIASPGNSIDSNDPNEKKCSLVPSHKKNGILLAVDGFLFNKNKRVTNKFYWECNKRKHSKLNQNDYDFCACKAVTQQLDSGEHKLLKISTHSHSANAYEAIIKTVRSEIKEKANETRIKPSQVIQDVQVNVDVSVQPNMPDKAALRKVIAGVRRRELPKEPQQLINLNIPDELRKTITGEMFLLKETKVGEDTILIFSTRANICRLAQSELWIGDGTFKTVPEIFLQLYTIHAPVGIVNAVTVPLVYALMTSKKGVLYDQLFVHLNELAYDFECELSPKFILTDYEIGAINAFKREFTEALMKGCYFHLGQNIYRKIQNLGLATKYGTDVQFSIQVRQVYALAFLPPSKIPNAFLKLKETLDDSLKEFLLWFEENYVLGRIQQKRKRTRRNSLEIRTPPLFPPELWSVYPNMENNFPRTTNQAETWHRRWNTLIGAAHVGTHFLISEMIKEEHKVNGDVERMIAGVPSARKKKDFIKREQRISLVLSKMDTSETLDTLKGLAYNLSF